MLSKDGKDSRLAHTTVLWLAPDLLSSGHVVLNTCGVCVQVQDLRKK